MKARNWIILVVLLGMLAGAVLIGYDVWKTNSDVPISESGYLAMGENRRQDPRRNGLFSIDDGFRGSGRLDGGERSHMRTRLHPQFPANREKYTEFCDLGASSADSIARSRCATATF